jgi:hypothetical protein
MSFRLFIYYCALCGGWAAFFGWIFGKLLTSGENQNDLLSTGLMGMFLGLFVALGLGLVDALWNLSLTQAAQISMRVGTALVVGAIGGFLGGLIGQLLYAPSQEGTGSPSVIFFVFGWTLTGSLIGASVGSFELTTAMMRKQDVSGAKKKLIKALIGGAAGGVVGGILALLLRMTWGSIFSGKDPNALWSPTATGFVALGMCIGLLIGLAQVILKEAWIRVESGFRPGREKILEKERTSIGRAEACDIGLFGDPGVEKMHANIVLAGNSYFLEDFNTPGGTYLNDQRVTGRMPLRSGDLIRVGKSVLCFRERQKRQ